MASIAPARARALTFWQKLSLGLALFIMFAFLQFAARGFVQPLQVPLFVHLHGVLMVSWLMLTVVQSFFAERADRVFHRRLGWFGAGLVTLVILYDAAVTTWIIGAHAQPFFFTPAYFLSLNAVGLTVFAALVAAAIVLRRRTEWHRRLIVGSTISIMGPALGRTLPMPLIMPWGGLAMTIVELGVLCIVARHDRRTHGRVHPATITGFVAIAGASLLIEVLSRAAPVIALAARIGGA